MSLLPSVRHIYQALDLQHTEILVESSCSNVSLVSAFIAAIEAAAPKNPKNLCDRIICDETDSEKVCAMNGYHYKVFDNSCELRKYNCNKGQSKSFRYFFFAISDTLTFDSFKFV